MKYIQSLFIRDDQNPFENSFGWVAPHYHLMGWALSCLTLQKQLGHLSLYCNRRAKELLIDILGLPYDEIHESMNGLEPPHSQLLACYHDNSYLGLDMFHEILSGNAKYFHLLGNYKADEFTCQQMAKTLHALYPQYYYRIISLFPELANEYAGIQFESECETYFIENKYLMKDSKEDSKSFAWTPDNVCSETLQDFSVFSLTINNLLKEFASFSRSYLNGRDSQSFYWYNQIMEKHQQFVVSPVIRIIKSSYDWAKLYRGNKTSGIEYYNSTSEVSEKGDYYSVIISELSPEGFSLFDIDEFEAEILNECKLPISIESLVEKTLNNVDSEVRENYSDKVKALIFECLKRLILMKTIQPVY